MRASKQVRSTKSEVKSGKLKETHISGAEGLYDFTEIKKIAGDYLLRAMSHPKGRPDKVVITIEGIREKPALIPLLPFSTVPCASPEEALKAIQKLLSGAGISRKAIRNGIRVVTGGATMRGASLIYAQSGVRAEPDMERGIRVSRIGIRKDSERRLSRRLSRNGINTTTVKEAIVLASKVASCPGVTAELCISDDPDYTTGYVASRRLGYVRVTNIKQEGSHSGGRVFFIKEGTAVRGVIRYLEERPVVAGI